MKPQLNTPRYCILFICVRSRITDVVVLYMKLKRKGIRGSNRYARERDNSSDEEGTFAGSRSRLPKIGATVTATSVSGGGKGGAASGGGGGIGYGRRPSSALSKADSDKDKPSEGYDSSGDETGRLLPRGGDTRLRGAGIGAAGGGGGGRDDRFSNPNNRTALGKLQGRRGNDSENEDDATVSLVSRSLTSLR